MQFPQDDHNDDLMNDSDTDFQSFVICTLRSIDNKLTSLCAQRDLMSELISNQLKHHHNAQTVTQSMMEPQQRPVYFKLTISKNNEGLPVLFRLSGRTYDIRDRIKVYSNPIWNKDMKCWDFEYNENTYKELVTYLSTLTNDITYTENFV